MCFSESMSLSFAIIGWIASVHFYKKNIYTGIAIFYFACMEFLQFLQYKVINQCNNKYNKFLTRIGYIHIAFQPLFFNIWLKTFTNRDNTHTLLMCVIAAFLMISRLFYVNDDELCDTNNEPLCGKVDCSFSGEKHIAWNLRLRAPGKYWCTPSIILFGFLWIVPTLVTFETKPLIAIILTLPFYLTNKNITSNIHEQPAIWCYTFTAQLLVSYILLK